MSLTIPQLATELNKIAPTRFSHFTTTQALPFITYTREAPEIFNADDITYYKNLNINVELYTGKLDITLHNQLEKFFTDNEIPFEITMLDEYVESEGFYMSSYSIIL